MTVQNPEATPPATAAALTPAETTAAVTEAVTPPPNAENMTAAQFREYMDSLPDKIADAIDVKFGLRRDAAAGTATPPASTTTEADPRKGGFLGTGKTFAEWWSA